MVKKKKIKRSFFSKKAGRQVFRSEFSKSKIPARIVISGDRVLAKVREKYHPIMDPRTGQQARIKVPKLPQIKKRKRRS